MLFTPMSERFPVYFNYLFEDTHIILLDCKWIHY